MMVGGQTWGAGGERYRLAVESLSLSILFYRCFLVVMYSLSISRLPLPIVFSPHLCTAAPPLPPFSPFSPHKPTGIMYEKKTAWAKYRAGSRVLHLTSIVRGCPGKDTDLWDGIAALKKKDRSPSCFFSVSAFRSSQPMTLFSAEVSEHLCLCLFWGSSQCHCSFNLGSCV